jgi:hypothetical protein
LETRNVRGARHSWRGFGGGIPATRPWTAGVVAVQIVILIQRRANRYASWATP